LVVFDHILFIFHNINDKKIISKKIISPSPKSSDIPMQNYILKLSKRVDTTNM